MKPCPSIFRGFLFLALFAILYACSSAPALAQGVKVDSADPPSAEQGTLNLNVTIKGRGFRNGAQAQFFVTGTTNPGGVTVNSTAFVSDTELVVNIDVADTAEIANFDIQVQNSNGRSGKGTELFAVTAKGSTSTGEPGTDLIAGFQDDPVGDSLLSDCGFGFDPQGDPVCPYIDGVDFVTVKFFDASLDFNPKTANRKEARRTVHLKFPASTNCPLDSPSCVPMNDPFGGELLWPARVRFGLDQGIPFEAMSVGDSLPATGGIFLDQVERNLNYIIRFQPLYETPADGFKCADSSSVPVSRLTVTRTTMDEWVLEAQGEFACLEEQHLKQRGQDFYRVHRGYLELPFKLVLRRLQ